MKKMMMLLAVTMMMVLGTAIGVSAATKNDVVIDKSRVAEGVVSIQIKSEIKKTTKVRIEMDKVVYDYFILNSEVTTFPLQSGAGTYKITIAENISGTKYAVVMTDTVKVDKFDEKKVFTNSIQLINFNGKMVSIVELNKLVANAKTDKDKLDIIYKFITENFKYDFDKMNEVVSNATYIPTIDKIYDVKKGICYDYASLFAAILRANNIPTKLEMGYFTQVEQYHAWNRVLVDGKWIIIDTTYDSQAKEYKMKYTMAKDAKEFKVVKEY